MYFKMVSNCKHEVTITKKICAGLFTLWRDIGRCPLFSHWKP